MVCVPKAYSLLTMHPPFHGLVLPKNPPDASALGQRRTARMELDGPAEAAAAVPSRNGRPAKRD